MRNSVYLGMPNYRGAALAALLTVPLWGQGETTSAIGGSVTDVTGAAIPAARGTLTSIDNGMKRTMKVDDNGRFNLPQLKTGPYSVKVEADHVEAQENRSVMAGLGQKQTVDFTLKIAASNQTITVSEGAPLVNPQNANTSTTLNARALEDMPNPGGDMTYPL